jgi:hypothetical protein
MENDPGIQCHITLIDSDIEDDTGGVERDATGRRHCLGGTFTFPEGGTNSRNSEITVHTPANSGARRKSVQLGVDEGGEQARNDDHDLPASTLPPYAGRVPNNSATLQRFYVCLVVGSMLLYCCIRKIAYIVQIR